jgi:integrase
VLKRLKIGVHEQISTEQDRSLAKKQLASVSHGEDPVDTRKKAKEIPTLPDLAKDYLERHASSHKRPKGISEDQQLLTRFIVPAFKHKLVHQITRRDVETLHLSLKKTPYQANRVMALLSKMFSCAISWGWCTENPVKGMARYQEEKRDRWLNQEELDRLWAVLDRYPKHLTAYVFKLLLLTGARKGEVLQATWDQFDLDVGVWTKPSHLTKQKKKEHLPLSEKALEVLLAVKQLNTQGSPYVFPGRVEGQPLKETKTFWSRVLKEAELGDFRIHDLRHTHASHLVSSGLSLSIVGKLLGHTQAATTQRYAHLADAPLRQAAELFRSKVGKTT